MKFKINILSLVFLLTSCYVMTYMLAYHGVPEWIILVMSAVYGLVFPWKWITVEEITPEVPVKTEEKSDDSVSK